MRILLLTLLATQVAVSATVAQSLGDVARREEARRKSIQQSGKVYTNESLRPELSPAPAAAASTPDDKPVPAAEAGVAKNDDQKKDEPKKDEPAKDQAYWQGRVKSERDALQRAQTFAEALQSRINGLSTDFAARDDPYQRAQIATDREKALAELARVKGEIEQHTKAIADIQEEARKAGVPAGWLR
ncbi:MAG TPA: hypothetical protein VL173_16540 [Vicinamibacterales bacterium]|jgi:hypothetical protein|nr:hypothetical protein [Vicinamibacterales bacterium]